jgi:hypothetical protein
MIDEINKGKFSCDPSAIIIIAEQMQNIHDLFFKTEPLPKAEFKNAVDKAQASFLLKQALKRKR